MTNSLKSKSLIKNRNRVKQVIDFTGLQNGKIHPSDIDAVFEFNNDVLILIEVKYRNSPIPLGQKMLLERISSSWHTDKSIVLKVEHDFSDDSVNIPLEKCFVTASYTNKRWDYSKEGYPLIDYLNMIGELWECKKCKF